MSNSIPDSSTSALALLYVQKQNISEITPEKLARAYDDAFTRIQAEQRKINNEKLMNKAKPIKNSLH